MNRVKAKAENKTQYIIDLIESDLDQGDIVGPTEIESQDKKKSLHTTEGAQLPIIKQDTKTKDKKKVLYDIPEGEIVGSEEIEKYY